MGYKLTGIALAVAGAGSSASEATTELTGSQAAGSFVGGVVDYFNPGSDAAFAADLLSVAADEAIGAYYGVSLDDADPDGGGW